MVSSNLYPDCNTITSNTAPQRRQAALCMGVVVTVGVATALALYYSLAPGTH